MILSIVTINFNNLIGLEKTYQSIVSQTWHDFEWIVIDGGSTDGSKQFLEAHQDKFSYWVSEPDNGIYNAMNKGIALARGVFINFMNSGDLYFSRDSIEKIIPYLEDCRIDVFYGDLLFAGKNEEFTFHYPSILSTHYFINRSLGHPASFINANLLKKERYREDLKIVSDWYSFFKWFREGKSFFHIEQTIAIFDTDGVSSKSDDLLAKEHNQVYEELLGTDNLGWVEESAKIQYLVEKTERKEFYLFDRIISRGGIRARLLSFILRLINTTF